MIDEDMKLFLTAILYETIIKTYNKSYIRISILIPI